MSSTYEQDVASLQNMNETFDGDIELEDGDLTLTKKRSDKNTREQMRYRKILHLIDNIREKLEAVGVLNVNNSSLVQSFDSLWPQGKESKTEVISAAGAYINQMKRQCDTYADLRAISSNFYV